MKAIMIQGTGSHVGKSYIATALCRIFKEDGHNVAPFKGWNMALNSWVTPEGGEIGRAQGEQALAAGVNPSVDMNPLLIKPSGRNRAQVVVLGSPWKDLTLRERDHGDYRGFCLQVIKSSLARLAKRHTTLVVEGAGSPAEINLTHQDVANMAIAEMAGIPVVLVADVDRGGALAAVVGTLELLPARQRNLVAGIIFNKFRGDRSLFEPAVSFIEEKTGIPVLGVLPFLPDIYLAAEDSLSLERNHCRQIQGGEETLHIAVLQLPHISNFTDFDALEREEGVSVAYVPPGGPLSGYDALILPGSKNTLHDLDYLRQKGGDRDIKELAGRGVPVVGICGGYQMLGKRLIDPTGCESDPGSCEGLGLLDVETTYYPDKCTRLVEGLGRKDFVALFPGMQGVNLSGYEIHTGETQRGPAARPLLTITRKGAAAEVLDGAVSPDCLVWGTYMHGIFDSSLLRQEFIRYLHRLKGKEHPTRVAAETAKKDDYAALASALRGHLDMEKVYKILEGGRFSL